MQTGAAVQPPQRGNGPAMGVRECGCGSSRWQGRGETCRQQGPQRRPPGTAQTAQWATCAHAAHLLTRYPPPPEALPSSVVMRGRGRRCRGKEEAARSHNTSSPRSRGGPCGLARGRDHSPGGGDDDARRPRNWRRPPPPENGQSGCLICCSPQVGKKRLGVEGGDRRRKVGNGGPPPRPPPAPPHLSLPHLPRRCEVGGRSTATRRAAPSVPSRRSNYSMATAGRHDRGMATWT